MAYKDPEKAKAYQREWSAKNKEKRKAYAKAFREKNPDYYKKYQENGQRKEYLQQYYQDNKEHINKKSNKWMKDNPQRLKELNHRYFKENKQAVSSRISKRNQEIKYDVLLHYSSNPNKPQCCGKGCNVDDIRCLTIDHINGDGAGHRKEMTGSQRTGGGVQTYRWLIKNNYPKGFQTLCMNCQFIKRAENNEHGKR